MYGTSLTYGNIVQIKSSEGVLSKMRYNILLIFVTLMHAPGGGVFWTPKNHKNDFGQWVLLVTHIS